MLLLLSNVFSRLFDGNESTWATLVVKASFFLTFFFGFLIIPLASEYLNHLISSRSGIEGLIWKYAEWAIFGIGAVLMILNLFKGFIYHFDEAGNQIWTNARYIPGVIGIFGLVISIGVVLEYLKYFIKFEKVAFVSYLLLPMIGIGADMVLGRISLTILFLVIATLLLFFSYEINSREYRVELERNLAEQQITMFHHQIQPHFIFNSLAVIKYQCRKSPEEAVNTIDEFSDYLRGCTDMMSETESVPVTRELELVRHYINLQQRRFDNKIDYKTSIEDRAFMVPPFSIQTCVENAFTHGLKSHPMENEHISVKTYRSRSSHIVEIEDNGVGFDVRELEGSSRQKHIGLINTEERIRLMCGGSFQIKSELGKGTLVTFTIPDKKGNTP